MAEPETTEPPKGKKGGSFLKKKIAGIPAPVVLVVGGVLVYYLYTKYKANSTASTSSTATPTASSGTPTDTSGGYTSAPGSSGGGYTDPNANSDENVPTSSPTDTSPLTPAPTATVNQSNITPTGAKTVNIGGKSYSTVSGFTQNGAQYLGVDNPAEAKKLTAAGVHLVQNPNDPNGKGEFILIPKGATGPVIKKPAAKAPAKKKVAAKK
jgi:hypothetical protein